MEIQIATYYCQVQQKEFLIVQKDKKKIASN